MEIAGLQTETQVDAADYRRALSRFATGVAILATAAGDGRGWEGVTIGSFTSVSLDPPLALWCLARGSSRFRTFAAATHVSVSVLGRGHRLLGHRFATRSAHFADGKWTRGITGSPLLRAAVAAFECEVVARHDGGDHEIFVGRVLDYRRGEGEPLVFHSGSYWHAAETA